MPILMQLIHYTCRQNLDGIKKTRELCCASSLMNEGKRKVRLPDDTEWECGEGQWSNFFARH